MGSKYGASRQGSTDATGVPHLALATAANEFAQIMECNWGGEVTTSTAMRTGVHRAAEGVGAATGLTEQPFSEQAGTATLAAEHSYATTDPAPEGGPILNYGWNAHGGVVRWLAAPGEEIVMLGASTVIIENSVGNAQATYGAVWEEL